MPKTRNVKPVAATTGSATNTNIIQQNSSLSNNQQWYPTQSALIKARQTNDIIVISKDIPPGDGPKAYTWFKSFSDLNTFLESNTTQAHFNEVIINNKHYPVYMFFDLDRDINQDDDDILEDIKTSRDCMIVCFMSKLDSFLKTFYKLEFDKLDIGHQAQISYTDSNTKLSAHIKVNIKFSNLADHKIFSTNLEKYIRSNIFTSDDERDWLMFDKPGEKDIRDPKCICDMSSYTNFKNYRMLYSSKLKKDTSGKPLIPYTYRSAKSSQYIKDHLVQVYDENPQTIIAHLTNLELFNIPANYDDVSPTFTLQELFLKPCTIEQLQSHKHKHETTVVAKIPEEVLDQVSNYLQSKEIEELLKVNAMRIREVIHVHPAVVRYIIDKQCQHVCPIAKRTHKNNHSYFDYFYKTNTVRYGCFNESCKQSNHRIKVKIRSAQEAIKQLSIMNNHKTLHCCNTIIKWDQHYDHPTMKQYPLKPLTIVRAGMGLGKTKALIYDYIPKHCTHPQTKCIFITYQQVLSKKYASELEEYGFINYLDYDDYDIYASKVIVCLDSLPRVKTTNFDFVFIDEALSVFLHFNSRFIKQSSKLCAQLEMVMLQARYIMLLDAVIDNYLTYDITQYFAEKKNVIPYCIYNSHVRVPDQVAQQRKAHIIVNSSSSAQAAMKLTIFKQALNALVKKSKVVIASSTKRFTEEIQSYINMHWPDQSTKPKTIIYNSDNVCDMTSDEINKKWQEYDALIYSPSITAGVSFEALHFDQMIAYIENSFYTPPVDIIMQQLFRVRQLKKGMMTLYINDTMTFEVDKYPVLVSDIDAHLNKDVNYVNKYFQDTVNFETDYKVDARGIKYDTEKLSYKILRGILMNRNKSLTMFVDILDTTLQEDYKVKVKRTNFGASSDFIRKAMKLLKDMRGMMAKEEIPFEQVRSITEAEYLDLEARSKRGEKLNDLQKQAKWYYKCCHELWKVDMEDVDQEFYDTYVGQCNDNSITKIINIYFKARRYVEMMNSDVAASLTKYHSKMNQLTDNKEYNIELYKTKTKEYYTKLIEGQRFLDKIFPTGVYKENLTQLQISKDDLDRRVKDYIASLSEEEFMNIIRYYGMSFETKDMVVLDDRRLTWFIKNMLKESFDVDVCTMTKSKNANNAKYSVKRFVCSLQGLISKYNPDIEDHNGIYLFVD